MQNQTQAVFFIVFVVFVGVVVVHHVHVDHAHVDHIHDHHVHEWETLRGLEGGEKDCTEECHAW